MGMGARMFCTLAHLGYLLCLCPNPLWTICNLPTSKSLATSSSPTVEDLRMAEIFARGCGTKLPIHSSSICCSFFSFDSGELRSCNTSSSCPNSLPIVSHLWDILGTNCGRTFCTASRSQLQEQEVNVFLFKARYTIKSLKTTNSLSEVGLNTSSSLAIPIHNTCHSAHKVTRGYSKFSTTWIYGSSYLHIYSYTYINRNVIPPYLYVYGLSDNANVHGL